MFIIESLKFGNDKPNTFKSLTRRKSSNILKKVVLYFQSLHVTEFE